MRRFVSELVQNSNTKSIKLRVGETEIIIFPDCARTFPRKGAPV